MREDDVKEQLSALFEENSSGFVKDFEAMSHELLAKEHGGVSRCAYDFVYEVALFNGRVAARLRSEDPGKWPFESFPIAPDEMKEKAAMGKLLRESVEQITRDLAALSSERLSEKAPVAGQPMDFGQLIVFCVSHMIYHDGQLNYIQAMAGDNEMHWDA